MTKIVPNTNVIISSIFWRGKPYQLMRKGIEGKCTLVTSMPIVDEVVSKLRSKFHLPEDKIGALVDVLLTFLTLVEPRAELNAVKADPSDNKIIECAVGGNAEYIVSGDTHLLEMFEYKGIKIVTPSQILGILK